MIMILFASVHFSADCVKINCKLILDQATPEKVGYVFSHLETKKEQCSLNLCLLSIKCILLHKHVLSWGKQTRKKKQVERNRFIILQMLRFRVK